MTTPEIIAAVKRWQTTLTVHPLTCGNNSQEHRVLRPVEREGQVILACPDCDFIQSYIPEVVLTLAKPSGDVTDMRG